MRRHPDTIDVEHLQVGHAYKLRARNIDVGIWDGEVFHGIRHKFGQRFMDTEMHYDTCEHHGTACPIRRLT